MRMPSPEHFWKAFCRCCAGRTNPSSWRTASVRVVTYDWAEEKARDSYYLIECEYASWTRSGKYYIMGETPRKRYPEESPTIRRGSEMKLNYMAVRHISKDNRDGTCPVSANLGRIDLI